MVNENSFEDQCQSEVVNLVFLARSLWKWKKIVIATTIACGLGAFGLALLLPRVYQSIGFFSLFQTIVESGKTNVITIPDYKRYESRLINPEFFINQAKAAKSLNSDVVKKIGGKIRSSEDLSRWIHPVYAFSREDIKTIGNITNEKENYVIGIKIAWEENSRKNAQLMVGFLGNYVRNQLMFSVLYDYFSQKNSQYSNSLKKLDNDKIRGEFGLFQLKKKLQTIRALMKNYPKTDVSGNRQVVSTQEGGYHYLSPAMQAVGIESQIADVNESLAVINRDLEKTAIGFPLFSSMLKELENEQNGETLFLKFSELVRDFSKKHDLGNSTMREFYNTVSMDIQSFERGFYQSFRFISGPTFPIKHIKPKRCIIVILITFFGGLLATMGALAAEWWKKRRDEIV